MNNTERAQLVEDLRLVLAATAQLSEDEHQWVKLAIRKEAQTIAFRNSIIEKTVSSLLWSLLAAAGIGLLELIRSYVMTRT